jgi:hypothetical protein
MILVPFTELLSIASLNSLGPSLITDKNENEEFIDASIDVAVALPEAAKLDISETSILSRRLGVMVGLA